MLFGYPETATTENWLHESLIAVIQEIHSQLDLGVAVPEWPEILPAAQRAKLQSRTGLRDRFEGYRAAVALVSKNQRIEILAAMHAQNRVADLLRCECDCPSIVDLPAGVQEPIKSLFKFAFELLTDLGIRHRQYAHIYKTMGDRVCPFCGCENFDAPVGPQEDFDHYLPRSIYPFAAANLRNLAPMGHKCNSKYKLAKDILRTNSGARRRAFDPYGYSKVHLSLNASQVNPQVDGPFVSAWNIEIQPADPEVETWDYIFSVRSRYATDALEDRNFRDWVWDFKKWFDGRPTPANDQELVGAVTKYADTLAETGFRDRAFLKAAVFRFLLTRLVAGCQRVLGLMRDATGMEQPAALQH